MSARTILKHLHQQGRMTDYQFDVINRNLKARPTGEWINQSQGAKYSCECSECHTEPFCNDEGYVLSDFCPNCGAKMTKETENER